MRSLTRRMRLANVTQVTLHLADYIRLIGLRASVRDSIVKFFGNTLVIQDSGETLLRSRIQRTLHLLEKLILNLQALLIGFDRTYGIHNCVLPYFHFELA